LNLLAGIRIYFSSVQAAEKDEAYPNLKLFSVVLDRVRSEYVDGGKLTYQELIYAALKGMLGTLDPHSEFMEPIKYDELKKDTQGEFGGVGIVISMKDNFLTVVAPMEDTPGFKAGVLSGDRIIKIDGRSTEKLSLPEAVKRLRGEPGSDVSVTMLRPSNGKIKEYKLTRAQIKVDTVKDINGKREFPLGDNNVGYIRLVQFGEHTAADLEDGLRKLEAKGLTPWFLIFVAIQAGCSTRPSKSARNSCLAANWSYRPKDAMPVRNLNTRRPVAISIPVCRWSCW